MVKLSIITINFNNLVGLIKTVESVVRQKCKDFEYIIIDGGSTDGSAEYIKKMQHNFQYSISEPDKGIYDAMNKGIRVSKGEYLLFLNSGDFLVNDSEILSNALKKLTADIVSFSCNIVNTNDEIVALRQHISKPSLYYIYKYGLKHQSTLIRADLFRIYGFYKTEYTIASDYEFWLRCALQPEVKFIGINLTLSNYILGGISSNNWQKDYEIIHRTLLNNIIEDLNLIDKLSVYEETFFAYRFARIEYYIKMIITKFYK